MEISLAVSVCLMLAAVLSSELKVSSAVIEILCGVVLVSLLPDIASSHWLKYLSHMGMLALMFVAGFEVQVSKFRQVWRPSVTVGVSSFLVPLAGVFLYTRYGLGFAADKACLVGIGLSTTSLALVYHVLKEHRRLETEEGQIIFGAASVVDILSMVSLAVLLGNAGWGTAVFMLFFVITAIGLPKLGDWMFRRYPNTLAEPELRLLMVILVGMGFMAESLGSIHPALVAFSIGMVMTGVLKKNEAVKDKMMSLVFSFFAPLFFLEAGTRIDVSYLNPAYLFIATVLFALAVSLKYLGTYIPVRLFGMENRRYIGILFNYRLTFGIITANVGLESGILSEEMYAAILLVVIAGAALPGILLRNRGAAAADAQGIDSAKAKLKQIEMALAADRPQIAPMHPRYRPALVRRRRRENMS